MLTLAMKSFRYGPGVAVASFLGGAIALHTLLQIPWAQAKLLVPYTRGVATAAAGMLHLLDPAIQRNGTILGDQHFQVQVLNVCNGTDVMVLFIAAVLAFPAPGRARLIGLAVGLPGLALLNLGRVAGLYLTGRYLHAAFEVSHLFVWQALLVVLTGVAFAIYVRWVIHEPDRG